MGRANIDNNIYALLTAGGAGLAIAAVTAVVLGRTVQAPIQQGARGDKELPRCHGPGVALRLVTDPELGRLQHAG